MFPGWERHLAAASEGFVTFQTAEGRVAGGCRSEVLLDVSMLRSGRVISTPVHFTHISSSLPLSYLPVKRSLLPSTQRAWNTIEPHDNTYTHNAFLPHNPGTGNRLLHNQRCKASPSRPVRRDRAEMVPRRIRSKHLPSPTAQSSKSCADTSPQQSIHAQHTYRDATPAWPIARGPLNDEYSWDARTAEKRNGRRRAAGESVSPLAKMKTYAELVYRGVGLDDRARQIGEAPVLQPRSGMVYDYTD